MAFTPSYLYGRGLTSWEAIHKLSHDMFLMFFLNCETEQHREYYIILRAMDSYSREQELVFHDAFPAMSEARWDELRRRISQAIWEKDEQFRKNTIYVHVTGIYFVDEEISTIGKVAALLYSFVENNSGYSIRMANVDELTTLTLVNGRKTYYIEDFIKMYKCMDGNLDVKKVITSL